MCSCPTAVLGTDPEHPESSCVRSLCPSVAVLSGRRRLHPIQRALTSLAGFPLAEELQEVAAAGGAKMVGGGAWLEERDSGVSP